MEEQTIETLNLFGKKRGAKGEVIDILALDFGIRHGAIIDERGCDGLREIFVDNYDFSYYFDKENGHWYVCSHPALLQTVERSHMTPERKQLGLGVFCSYDHLSVVSYVRDEVLSMNQVEEMAETEFEKFLAQNSCYSPYLPAPTRLDCFFSRAEKRYEIAKVVEPLLDFDFPEFKEEEKMEVEHESV
jgi:hypothetical protein